MMLPDLIHAARSGESLADYIEQLDAEGHLALLLPEVKALQGLEHDPVHHPEGDVWTHVMLCVRASESADPIINLAILFHDLGKAVTRSYGDDGRVHYYAHEAAGVPVFETLAQRLGMAQEQQNAIGFGIENHMQGHQLNKLSTKKVLALRQDPRWELLYHVTKADEKVRQHLWNPAAFEQKMAKADQLVAQHAQWLEHEQRISALVDGRLILSLLPTAEGSQVGKIKARVRAVIEARNFQISPDEVRELILGEA